MDKLTKTEIEEILIKLASEEFLSADEWIDLWNKNHQKFQEVLPRIWYLKIKPALSQTSLGTLSISSNNAKLYLDSIGKSYKYIQENLRYSHKWRNEPVKDSYNLNYSSLNIIINDYPKFINFIIKNKMDYLLTMNDNPAVIDAKKYSLPIEIINFFKKIERFNVEYFTLEASAIYTYVSKNRMKIGEFWVYNDGDELFVKENDVAIYLLVMHTQEEEKIANSFEDLLNNVLVEYLEEEDEW